MKRFLILVVLLVISSIFIGCGASSAQQQAKTSSDMQNNNPSTAQELGVKHKILVAYFSHSGNTRSIANQIHSSVGGDIFEIKTVKHYETDFETTVDEAREELHNNARPELATKVKNMQDYDVVFLGFPNWCGTMPMALFTFLEQYDFKGKTIVPFCTHGSSGLGNSIEDLKRLSLQANIKEALGIHRQDVRTVDNTIRAWLHNLGYIN